jgi:ribonuclease-3
MKTDNSLVSHFSALGITFQEPNLLKQALIHRSYLNEQRQIKESNERLEYLGDAVLELVVSEFLYRQFPQKPEGQLTSLRAKVVQTKTLSAVAQALQLGKYLKLSRGEAASGGATNPSLLADTFEAVVGALYLDQGLEATQQFVRQYLLKDFAQHIAKSEVQDFKSQLQEVVQAQKGDSPVYELVKAEGPDHDRIFTIRVVFFGKTQARGTGRSKQTAEQQAAKTALEKLAKSQ